MRSLGSIVLYGGEQVTSKEQVMQATLIKRLKADESDSRRHYQEDDRSEFDYQARKSQP